MDLNKYIYFKDSGNPYRFSIDENLERRLKNSLKEDYIFDTNNNLILEKETPIETYKTKQKVLKELIGNIRNYDLPKELEKQVFTLENGISARATNVYASDLKKIESILAQTIQIYGTVRNSLPTKEQTKQREEELKNVVPEILDQISEETKSTKTSLEEVKEILLETAKDQNIEKEITPETINEALNNVIICDTIEEFIEKTGEDVSHFDLNAYFEKQDTSKKEKIILPPNISPKDVASALLKSAYFEDLKPKSNEQNTYQEELNSNFKDLKDELGMRGINESNADYYGLKFIKAYMDLCKRNGKDPEAMFRAYFIKKERNELFYFLKDMVKYSGGNDSVRTLLEQALVNQAVNKKLISRDYLKRLTPNTSAIAGGSNMNITNEGEASGTSNIRSGANINTASPSTINQNTKMKYQQDVQAKGNIEQKDELAASSTFNKDQDQAFNQNSRTDLNGQEQLTGKEYQKNNQPLGPNQGQNHILQNPAKNRLKSAKGTGIVMPSGASAVRGVTGVAASASLSTDGGGFIKKNNALNPAVIEDEELAREPIYDEYGNLIEPSESNDETQLSDSEKETPSQETPENNENQQSNVINDGINQTANEVKKKAIKKVISEFIKKRPYVLIVGGVILLFVFIIGIVILTAGNSSNSNGIIGLYGYDYLPLETTCDSVYVYNTSSGDDGTYTFEEYVAGVVAAEVGGFNNSTVYEVFAILARTYALNYFQASGECSIAGDTTKQAFKVNISEDITTAVSKTRGIVVTKNDSLFSTEYDAFCWTEKTDSYYVLQNGLQIPIEWAKSNVWSSTYLNCQCNANDTTNTACYYNGSWHDGGHGRGLSQYGALYLASEKEYDSTSIINFFYGNDIKLMSIYKSAYTGEYPLDPNNELYQNLDFLTNTTLEQLLSNNGSSVEELNNYLASIVENSGVGTRSAVANVAVSLIGSLANMGYKLNYQWGGKYYYQGVRANWGVEVNMSSICDSYIARYGNGNKCLNEYKYASFDCSGFVNWALINGFQLSNYNELQEKGMYSADANYKKVALNNDSAVCEAGDVLVTSGHIVLIVGTDDEKKSYIVAEATGSNLNQKTGGVKLTYYSYGKSGYTCGSYAEFYDNYVSTSEDIEE